MRALALVMMWLAGGCRQGAAASSDGKQLFESVCARCHAADGRGEPTAKLQLGVPDMTDRAWQAKHTDDDIKRTVHEGSKSKKMPPFGEVFSDAQLDAIIHHVRSLALR